MPPADYQRVSQEGHSEDTGLGHNPTRSAAQYGTGPFDSDDEDEELLHKEHPSTPGVAEQGFDEPEFPGLVVGGYHVRKPLCGRGVMLTLCNRRGRQLYESWLLLWELWCLLLA